jgi:F-type H+-transporting ATPase subunit b
VTHSFVAGKRFFALVVLAASLGSVVMPALAQQASIQRVAVQASGSEGTPQANSAEANQGETDATEAYRKSPMVKKLGGMMGMKPDAAATTFEVINFALLALAIGYGLLKALPKTFRDRSLAIQKHLVEAKAATEEASARLNSVEERLAKLDGQIAEMRSQAEKDMVADTLRIRATVEDEKQKILDAAEQEITAASLEAQRSLQRYAAELAIEQAARKLVVSAETDRLLVQGFARRLGIDPAKGGEN